jgi:hypothetical protein
LFERGLYGLKLSILKPRIGLNPEAKFGSTFILGVAGDVQTEK